MSFSFTANGTAPEVSRQLRATEIYGDRPFPGFASKLRDLLAEHFGDAGDFALHVRHEYRYHVTVNGHGGDGSPVSLNVQVVGGFVAKPDVIIESEDEPGRLCECGSEAGCPLHGDRP